MKRSISAILAERNELELRRSSRLDREDMLDLRIHVLDAELRAAFRRARLEARP